MYFLKIERCIEVSTFKLCNSDSMVVSKRSYEQNKGCDFIKKKLNLGFIFTAVCIWILCFEFELQECHLILYLWTR